jgi:hypothetical protein
MKLNINDTISWSSAIGNLKGVIINISLSLNAAKRVVPWIDIKTIDKRGYIYTVRLCGADENLKMMRVAKVEVETV